MDRKIAVITGGTGGIGSAICRRLAKDYGVVACYFKNGAHAEAQAWQQSQKAQGFEIDIIYGDVTRIADCEKMAALIQERYGRVDILINNAGLTADATLKKMSYEQWQQVLDANLNSVFNMVKQVLPGMLDRGFGRIISISSINGRKGQFGQCNYAASKSAMYGFTKSLALEVAAKGITVNTISPGYIQTPMLSHMKDDILKNIIAAIPIGRLGKPEEVAEAVAFLVSEHAGFMTGANLDINGGQYM